MQTPINLFLQILIGKLCPWLIGDYSDDKYRELTTEVTEHSFQFQPLYKVDFLNPVFPKRKYYAKLVEGAAIEYFNDIHFRMDNALTEDHKYFLIHTSLKKELRPLLEQVANIVADKNLVLDDLINPSNHVKANRRLADNIYILHLLKFQLIWLYQEIQDKYKTYAADYYLSFDDMIFSVFNEDASQKRFISNAEPIGSLKAKAPSKTVEPEDEFKPVRGQIRIKKNGILTYDEIVEDKNGFASLEAGLFRREMIDKDYNFKKKPFGNQVRMAAVYHIAFQKGLFKKLKFPGAKPMTVEDVQEFLNYRYDVDIKKEFTEFKRVPQKLDDLLKRDPGLQYLA